MTRDYAATAHVHAADAARRPSPWAMPAPMQAAYDAAAQSTLPPRRFSPLAHAYLIGFGDAA